MWARFSWENFDFHLSAIISSMPRSVYLHVVVNMSSYGRRMKKRSNIRLDKKKTIRSGAVLAE